MGVPANPPPQSRLPDKIFNDDELRPFFTSIQSDVYRIWLRSGGGTDKVSEIVVDLDTINARLDDIELRLNLLEPRVTYLEGLTIVTAVDITIDNVVTGHQTVVCTAAVTIKLDATPTDRDTAEIKQTGFQVIMDGNGKNIEGNATVTLRKRNTKLKTGLVVRYSSAADEWFTT